MAGVLSLRLWIVDLPATAGEKYWEPIDFVVDGGILSPTATLPRGEYHLHRVELFHRDQSAKPQVVLDCLVQCDAISPEAHRGSKFRLEPDRLEFELKIAVPLYAKPLDERADEYGVHTIEFDFRIPRRASFNSRGFLSLARVRLPPPLPQISSIEDLPRYSSAPIWRHDDRKAESFLPALNCSLRYRGGPHPPNQHAAYDTVDGGFAVRFVADERRVRLAFYRFVKFDGPQSELIVPAGGTAAPWIGARVTSAHVPPTSGRWWIEQIQAGSDFRLIRNLGEMNRQGGLGPSGKVSVWHVVLHRVGTDAVAGIWNAAIAYPYLQSIETIRDGQNISIVPEILWSPPEHAERFLWRIVYEVGAYRPETADCYQYQPVRPVAVSPIYRKAQGNPSRPDFTLKLPGFRTHAQRAYSREVTVADADDFVLGPPPDDGFDPPAPTLALPPTLFPALKLKTFGRALAPESIRVGALDLKTSDVLSDEPLLSITTTHSVESPGTLLPRPGLGGKPVPRVELTLSLPLREIAPGGQDPVPDQGVARVDDHVQGRNPALVFSPPLPHDNSASVQRFWLRANELTAEGRSQSLAMRIELVSGVIPPSENVRAIVVDQEPFLVAQVEMEDFASLASSGSDTVSEVANWSLSESEGARWEVIGGDQGYDVTLPPQTIGEAMEKGYQTELGPPPGIPTISAGTIDFRLGPPARFKLLTSYYRQRYAEAPWNLRRVLGYVGQRAPGAGLKEAQFELLYGLSARMTAPNIRLTEITARFGAPPAPVDESPRARLPAPYRTLYEAYRQRWEKYAIAYGKRLAVLEPYREGSTTALTLTDDIEFTLRKTASLRDPIRGRQDLSPDDQFTREGLAGGATWGFESANILAEVCDQPVSVGGLVKRPSVSALGGWGYQKAEFAKGKSAIYSDTAMGRVFFYSIERIGRIAAFWNRAKHVIVYERTVWPSDQFNAEQPRHARRPVLRKVREFVEILEPERRYPESGAAPETRGFVLGSNFKTTRIPVNGRWGEDVEGGWTIPLWRRGEDPELYPMPQIALRLAGAEQELEIPAQIINPDNLYFYTSTDRTLDANTDLWPPYAHIDYANMPRPSADDEPALDAEDPDAVLPDADDLAPGLERFTFRTVPQAPANLVRDRAEGAVSALIENVTMMRASPVANTPEHAADAVNAPATFTRLWRRLESDLSARLTALGDAASAEASKQELVSIVRRYQEKLAAAAEQASAAVAKISGLIDQGGDVCEKVKKEIKQQIVAKRDLILGRIGEFEDALKQELRPLLEATSDAKNAVKRAASDCAERAGQTLKRFATDFNQALGAADDVLAEIEAVQRRLNDQARTFEQEFRQAGAQFEAQRAAVARHLERARKVLDGAAERMRQAARGRFAKYAETAGTACKGLIEELDRISAQLAAVQPGGALDAVVMALRDIASAADAGLSRAARSIEGTRSTVRGGISAILGEVEDEIGSWTDILRDRLVAEIDKVSNGGIDKYDASVKEGFKQFRTTIGDKTEEAVNKVDATITPICTALFDSASFVDKLTGWGKQEVADALAEIEGKINEIGTQTYSAIKTWLRQKTGGIVETYSQAKERLEDAIARASSIPSLQNPSETLRLIRAFGKSPVLPQLSFNRERIAYFFDDLEKAVKTSPAAALFNRVDNDLAALGIRLPTKELADRLIPDALQNFDIAKILPDFAGLRLNGLFKGLKMPAIAKDKVRVTHGLNKEAQAAWAKVDADFPLGDAEVLNIGAIVLTLRRARMEAHADVEVKLGQAPRRRLDGRITGDWDLKLGGTRLVSFVSTTLAFDDRGKIDFDFSPDKIQLDRAVEFLADLVRKLGDPNSGFTVELTETDGRPTGVRAVLDLPLPPTSAGAFAISGLRFTASLALQMKSRQFCIDVGFALGRQIQPFTLMVAFLNGGGWLESELTYDVSRSRLVSARVSLGIVAGAGVDFRLGPIGGAVYVQFGVFGDFIHRDGTGNSFNVGIMLLVRGEVVIFAYISISLALCLTATYESGSRRLVGRGHISLTIKICWCVKIKVSHSVEYVLGRGSGGGGGRALARQRTYGETYLAMYE